jgi:hypothetical protein
MLRAIAWSLGSSIVEVGNEDEDKKEKIRALLKKEDAR